MRCSGGDAAEAAEVVLRCHLVFPGLGFPGSQDVDARMVTLQRVSAPRAG